MKKSIVSAIIISCPFSVTAFGQTVKASIGLGSTANSVRIYLKTDVTQSPASFSTLQFNLAIPAGTSPVPTAAVISNAFGILNSSWIVGASYTEGGYINYNIYTATSPLTINATANTEFQAMEVSFTGGPITPQTVSLVSLPDGGLTPPQYAVFYATGTVNSDGHSQLYYVDPGVTVNNQFSYDNPSFAVSGTGTSTASFTGVLLPVTLTDFNVIKSGNDGLLTWTVQDQSADADHFDIERSFNGTDFVKIGRTDVNHSSGSVSVYRYTDVNVAASKRSGIIYYRIRSIELNGRSAYTQIKNIRLESGAFDMSISPNPASFSTNLSYGLKDAGEVVITVTDASGKEVIRMASAGISGSNLQRINVSSLASGRYVITLRSGNQVQSIPFIKGLAQ